MKKKILIVEDDMVISMVNARYVKMCGFDLVGCAKTSSEAITMAKNCPPEIILMDVKIKGEKDGIDTMKEISRFCDAKVVYITGNSDAEVRSRAADTNMLAFCVKPINMDELKMVLEKENNLWKE